MSVKYTKTTVAIAVALVSTVLLEASASDRFELYNKCSPVDLLVEHLDEDAKKTGLTSERIQTVADFVRREFTPMNL